MVMGFVQDLVDDQNCGTQFMGNIVANCIQAELQLKTDVIDVLNQGKDLRLANVRIKDGCAVNACELQLGNTGNSNYTGLISHPSLGITYNIVLPSTAPSDDNMLVYSAVSGGLVWTDEKDLMIIDDLVVNNISTSGSIINVLDDIYIDGNIGIGVSLPTNALEVAGSVIVQNQLCTSDFKMPTGAVDGYVLTSDSAGNATWEEISGGSISVSGGVNQLIDTDGDTSIEVELFPDEDQIRFITSGLGRMIITDDGNIGIGTTGPIEQLHISENALIQGGKLYFVDTNEAICSDGTDMYFTVDNAEVVRFQQGGNVGIGISNPTQQLHIAQNALIQGGSIYLADTNEAITSNGNDMFFTVNGSEVIIIDNGGNVGIGTNNPEAKLEVEGNSLFNGTIGISGNTIITNTSSSAFVVENNNGGDCFIIDTITCGITLDGSLTLNGDLNICTGIQKVKDGSISNPSLTFCNDLDTGLYLQAADELGFTTNSINRMSINATGNVGIGVSNPTQQLHIAENVLIQGGNLYLTDTNEAICSDGTDMYFTVNGDEVVRFESGGDVGIGVSNPTQQLHIAENVLIQGGNLYLTDTNEAICSDGTDMYFTVNGDEVVRFESGGNVGIGIVEPTTLIHGYHETKSPELFLEYGGGEKTAIVTSTTGSVIGYSDHLSFGTITDSELTNYNELIRLTSNGDLGIGTEQPSAKLEVEGTTLLNGTLGISGDTVITNTSSQALTVESNDGIDCLVIDTISCSITFAGDLNIGGDSLLCGDVDICGNLGISGDTSLSSLIVQETSVFEGGVNIEGAINASGGVTGIIFIAKITDEKTIGTNGGSFSSGSWMIRDLNTLIDSGNIINSLINNEFSINPGLYHLNIQAPARDVKSHQCRLYNVSDATTVALGSNAFNQSSQGYAILFTEIEISGLTPKIFRVEHRCSFSRPNTGFGESNGWGTEIYTQVLITKVTGRS